MQLAVALLYWVIVSLWLAVLAIVCVAYFRNPRIFGAARLLLAVLIIDTCRNISENLFFGLYWGGQYGLFPFQIASALGKPEFVILPKLMNVVAGCAVLGLLILKWLPTAMRDRAAVEAEVHRATEALRLESKRLDWLAHFDQLTELPNRISLLNDIEKLKRQHPRGHITSLALIDLDGFGNINDTLGHATGDQLLRDAAARLVSSCRGFARIYRSSGDEFVLLMTNCSNQSQVVSLIERALKELSERFDIAGHQLFLGASAGIAIASGSDDVAIDELVSNADLALNEARISGGHSCRLFQPPLRAAAQARRELDIELRRAWAGREFVLYFQPQMRVSDGALTGAEALLRWQHPTRGLLGPAEFIDVLSTSPVALEIGRWILGTACRTAVAWRAKGAPLRMSVNLFPSHFSQQSLLQDVEAALAESGLPADALELEITENIALSHDEAMLTPLQALRAKGVGLSFDDFGTGFASLSYLTRFPLTRIKIDRSFIAKINDTPKDEDRALLISIIGMAHSLHLEVVAEGVETANQADFLRAQGCDEVQGYLYAKPLSGAEFEEFIANAQKPSGR